MSLAYAGYCARCEAPALAGEPLVCPRCEAPAEPVPPPFDLVARWFPAFRPDAPPYSSPAFSLHAAARALVTGQPMNDAFDELHRWRQAQIWCDQPEPTHEDLLAVRALLVELLAQVDADLERVDGTGLGIALPPRWQAPADDRAPDPSTSDPIAALLRRILGE